MLIPVSNIHQRFHNLSGITVGNRKKELFLLLNENKSVIQTPEGTDYLVQHLKPTTYLEQKLFVDILIYCKCQRELLTLLLEGNEILIKPLWNQAWFFENLIQDRSIEYIVDEIFPHLSYVSRIRFLKNIIYYTKDEEKIDKLYEIVLDKYGIENAKYILAGCSMEKILETIAYGHIVAFSNEQLIFLHKNRNAHFQKLISLKNRNEIFDFYDRHSKAFRVIAGTDYNIFMEIFQTNYLKIGKKLTRKMVKHSMPYLQKEASTIYGRLHTRTLLKNLKSDFKNFFFATWPSSFRDFSFYSCFSSMKYCLKEKYVDIIQEGLQKRYNTSLSEHPELINDILLKNTKNIQLRESLLELKMQNSKDDYTLPKYYGIEKSIPILKKKISGADGVRTRENLVVALVSTCEINNDIDALLKVQEYFNFRHKNDDETIRSGFLHEIQNCFNLSHLTEAHWKLIFDLIKWSKVKAGNYWGEGEYNMMYLKFLYQNNTEMENIRKLLFDSFLTSILNSFTTCWNKLDDAPILQKYLLLKLIEDLSPSCYKEERKIDLYFEFFKAILSWNEKNPADTINFLLCPDIKEAVKIKLKEPCRSYSQQNIYLKNFIKKKIPCEDGEFVEELEQIFWDNISDRFDVNIIEFYLRNNPTKITQNFDKFILGIKEAYLCDSVTMWRLVKHYDHLGLTKNVIDHFTSNEFDMIGNCAIGLATLLKPETYIKSMSSLKSDMLDVDDKEQVKNHRLAMKFLDYAKFNNSFSILPNIVQFCEGDSLHEALPPLYYYFQHCPEMLLSDHLQTLSNRAVSVRKHAIKLACSVSQVENVFNLIQEMTNTEKNQSVLEHIYWKTFKYFLVSKSEKFWFLLQGQLKSLDILESNAFKDSCDLKKIPKQFRLSYLNFLWELLDEREKEGQNVSEFKELIINSLTPEIFKELPSEFCKNFIKDHFLKFGRKSDRTAKLFTINCLKYCSQKELLLNVIFDIIKEFKTNFILNPDFKISCKSHSYVDEVVYDIFHFHEDFELPIIEAFFSRWIEVFTSIEDILNFMRLKLLVELKKVVSLDNFVLKVVELYKQFLREFGILGIIDCFKDTLCSLLPNDIFGTTEYDQKIYKLALKLTEIESNELKLLAIYLLPRENPENSDCKEIQKKLIENFRKSGDKSVLINCNMYINSLED